MTPTLTTLAPRGNTAPATVNAAVPDLVAALQRAFNHYIDMSNGAEGPFAAIEKRHFMNEARLVREALEKVGA